MRKFILVVMMCVSLGVSAQRVDKPGEPYDYFCILTVDMSYTRITIDDWYRELLDENGKRLGFGTPANAINYMTKRGWLYVDKIDEKHFLFKITVTSDEQAMQHLNISKK